MAASAGMEISQHIAALEDDGVLLADAAATAGLTASVPTCPEWHVRDLIRHQAFIHDWAARHVAEQRTEIISGAEIIGDGTEEDILGGGPPDGELIAKYRQGHAALVRALRNADPDVRCATFLDAPSPLAFWARRQAHETAIHRFDAQAARSEGPPPPHGAFDPAFAADGIDELITGFAAGRRTDGSGRSLLVLATDTGDAWHYTWPAEGRAQARRCDTNDAGTTSADCTLAGPASGIYVFLWNRCAADDANAGLTGAPDILHAWNSTVRVRWR